MDISILEDLGLTNAEIKIYIALLEIGSSTAGPIIEKSNLQNSVVHRALITLIDKGLINYVLEGKNKVYQATDPKFFYDFIEDKKKRFDQILPELKSKQTFAKKDIGGTLYKGRKGINVVYNLLVNSGAKEYLTFGGGEECVELMGETWWSNIHRKRIANNLSARQVWDITVKPFLEREKFMQTELTKIKFLPEEFAHFQETAIVGDYVAITIFTDNPYSMLIKDPLVAEGYRKYFELMWKSAKE